MIKAPHNEHLVMNLPVERVILDKVPLLNLLGGV